MKKACDRCNKGLCDGGESCNRNYSGSSGGMEATAGGDMISELVNDTKSNGIRLVRYITDLDAKTAAAVRAKFTGPTTAGQDQGSDAARLPPRPGAPP